jgi:hypothetical protein
LANPKGYCYTERVKQKRPRCSNHPVAAYQDHQGIKYKMSITKLKRSLAPFVQVSSETLQELIAQLIELSSRGDIRVTDDGNYSIYDVIDKVVEKGSPRKSWERLTAKHLEVVAKCHNFQFPGQGQRLTPVTDLAGIIEIIWLLPGDFSNKFRKLGAKVVSEVINSQDNNQASLELMSAVNQLTSLVQSQNQTINQLTRKLNNLSDRQEETNAITSEYIGLRKYVEDSWEDA